MLFAKLVDTSATVARTPGKKAKVAAFITLLRELAPDEREIGARFAAGTVPHKTNVGYATVGELRSSVPPASEASLTLIEVDRRFAELATMSGTGSSTARKAGFGALLARATLPEQAFLAALAIGEIRQGALEAVVIDALAQTTELPLAAVRAAYMLSGDIGIVADAALADGAAGLARFGLTLFRPILPMLAQTADDAAEALTNLGGEAALEHKLDGFRVQIHKDGDLVRMFSRNLNDVTSVVPEIVDVVRALPARRLILDGEAIAFHPNGRPRPFQDTMRRFGRRDSLSLRNEIPLSLSVFDALLVDDHTLVSEPARARFAAITEAAPAVTVPRTVVTDASTATAFYDDAIARGHEGVMAKALDAPYDAGNRGAAWLKIKKIRRLDLVILAAEWGSGRRKGWLSNVHLGARDTANPPTGDGFVMLGKTFKGMTDEMLRWQTAELLAREIDRDGHVVYVRPEIVAEVAFNDVLRSPHYPGGLALRHARIVDYRKDKTAAEADTIDAVRAIAIADGVI